MSVRVEEVDGLPEPAELFRGIRHRRGSFLLESSLNVADSGRYSFIGCEPFETLVIRMDEDADDESTGTRIKRSRTLEKLREVLRTFRSETHPRIPFVGGVVGWFSYELGASWEGIQPRARSSRAEALRLGLYDGVLAYEHGSKSWFLVANSVGGRSIEAILAGLRMMVREAPEIRSSSKFSASEPGACEDRACYLAAVDRIREYIRSGDVYQANLAQRFTAAYSGDPYALYLRLRRQSPAPFACYLAHDSGAIVSCSPERFLQVRGRRIETRPIKGTRTRGTNIEEDTRLSAELAGSAKERAELLMIVDLERNDLGRVCQPGSIRVEDLYRVEDHPTVKHLVATVSGELRPDVDLVDVLKATFPGGSITGAPKVRAMQVIRELETHDRGIYTGAIGYLGFDGSCDLNIAIRTIDCRDGLATYHVGAGIVWDSERQSEFDETLAKGRALRAALVGE
jgi:para-aminobenzoate synthetase component I